MAMVAWMIAIAVANENVIAEPHASAVVAIALLLGVGVMPLFVRLVHASDFDDDLRLAPHMQPLDTQAFVAELGVEGFVSAVPPRFAGTHDGQ